MFEKFQEVMYELGAFDVDEVTTDTMFLARHVESDTRESWCKVIFEVKVLDGCYSCECGMFEHMGMMCRHVVKVLLFRCAREIPEKHILKRWTVDARDVLPAHLKHYQKDQDNMQCFSYRHSQLYTVALELVRLGDTNVQSYESAMEGLRTIVTKTAPLAIEGDGLGLLERQLDKQTPDRGTFALRAISDGSCSKDTAFALRLDPDLLAPCRARSGGRPSNSREKPMYEEMSKRTRFYTICRLPGHKRSTCPKREIGEAKPRKEAKCSNCGLVGHRKTTCVKANAIRGLGPNVIGCPS